MNNSYSKWSAILAIICAAAIFASYAIAPKQPEGMMVVLIQVLFFTAIITGLLSLIFSFVGVRKKEPGYLKFVAPVIVCLVILTFLISFAIMVVSFF
ncbi:hypothetical protein ERJ70_16115 [Sediminibacillus dalangtanensis]|uniref:Uncharacterized protein n=1 Tax=Sediminibacillus dalangtanensis TaxID=2729421 RepID=A0ABX7VYD7_9BACI|nr:hypothetical protein [Sediminibacillus dalangtanensis]QTN00681.1 hypothetical protein ERJ70_16115 [Sediminibacillus dalangtanensis]